MTRASEVRDYIAQHTEELIEDLRLLVHLETPSSDVPRLNEALTRIEEYVLGRLGAPAERTRHDGTLADGRVRGDVLELAWAGTTPGEVLSICHYDTVWPVGTVTDWPLTLGRDGDDDVITGPGVLDMKAGLVQTVWMLRALRDLGIEHPGVRLLLTGDEEIGSLASRPHIERCAAAALVTLIAEPSGSKDVPGAVKVQRKGIVFADLHVTGVESHAGLDPLAGASAIHEIARLIPQVADLGDQAKGTTVNVGLIHGGSGRNVIAGRAHAEVDIRIQDPAEEERVVAALEALRVSDERTTVQVVIDRNRPPMNATDHTRDLLRQVAQVGEDLGESIGEVVVGGASDGNFIAALGLPVIDGLGGIGTGPHARHEYISRSGLARQTALMAGITQSFAQS